MKTPTQLPLLAALAIASSVLVSHAADWTAGMKPGKAPIQSISQLTFGPDGILFVADSKAAAVIAIATGDTKAAAAKPIKIEAISEKLAAMLGTSADQILIADLAVNPISHSVYVGVARGRGPTASHVIARVTVDGKLDVMPLDKAKFSVAQLPDAPVDGVVGDGKRSSNPRQESVTDIAFLEDRVLIAGLSNEEFASTLRAIPFPFQTVPNGTTVEIYHGAHGRFETRSPVRTFVAFNVGNQPSLLAAYTCTPLVQFPISDLKPGAKIKGKTIAELGNRNRPLDMIVYQKGGKDFILMANSSRGVMKISTANIEKADGIETKVNDKQGQPYETIEAWKGIDQLDKLDAQHALVLRRNDDNSLVLEALPLP